MAVLPEFDPQYQATGRTANQLIGGMEAGQSMMARAQAMRIQQQQADMQQQEFQAKLPVIQAEAQAHIVGAQASVANATRMAQLRTKAAAESASLNNEYLDAMQYADWNTRSDALAALQPKVSYMALFPEYKGFVDTVNNSRVEAHNSAVLDAKLEESQQRAEESRQARVDAAAAAGESRVRAAEITAGARTENAQTYTQSRERIAGTTAANKLDVQVMKNQGQAELPGNRLEDLSRRAAESDQQAALATANGHEEAAATYRETAQHYRDAAAKESTYAGGTPTAPAKTSPPLLPPHPATGAEGPPAAVSITIPGSDLPPSNEPAKLYVVDPQSRSPALSPAVKTPRQILDAYQQMIDDGVVTPEQAREKLTQLGFRPKG